MWKQLPILVLTCMCIYAQSLPAQQYDGPESAVFDATGNRHFISNYYGGTIVEVDSTGSLSCFKTDVSSPLGMVLHNDILYVVENPDMVAGYTISDGSEIVRVTIPNALFLNDITIDAKGMLFVTDSDGTCIYRIDPDSGNYSLFAKTSRENPNGILCDQARNRLIVCYFDEPAAIHAIDLTDKTIIVLYEDDLINLDGIAMDNEQNIYVSAWGHGNFTEGFNQKGVIYKFEPTFSSSPEIITTDHYGPADIYYNTVKQTLVIPYLLDDVVAF